MLMKSALIEQMKSAWGLNCSTKIDDRPNSESDWGFGGGCFFFSLFSFRVLRVKCLCGSIFAGILAEVLILFIASQNECDLHKPE